MTSLLTPLDITGILIEILKDRFKQSTRFKYDDNKLMTKVVIGPSQDFDPTDTNHRVGLFVKRDDIIYTPRVGMNDMYAITSNGNIQYAAFATTSWTIFAISKLPGEVEFLSSECIDTLLCFAPIIRRHFLLDRFLLSTVSGINEIQEYKSFYNIAMKIQCSYNERWEIAENELPITDFEIIAKTYLDKRKADDVGLII